MHIAVGYHSPVWYFAIAVYLPSIADVTYLAIAAALNISSAQQRFYPYLLIIFEALYWIPLEFHELCLGFEILLAAPVPTHGLDVPLFVVVVTSQSVFSFYLTLLDLDFD